MNKLRLPRPGGPPKMKKVKLSIGGQFCLLKLVEELPFSRVSRRDSRKIKDPSVSRGHNPPVATP